MNSNTSQDYLKKSSSVLTPPPLHDLIIKKIGNYLHSNIHLFPPKNHVEINEYSSEGS